MMYGFDTDKFRFEYMESTVENPVLWENHCHSRFEMISVLEGDSSIMLEGKNYRLTENQTVIIPPLSYHTVTANKNGLYRRITVLFDACAIPEAIREHFLKRNTDIPITVSSQSENIKKICIADESATYAPLAEALMVQIFYDNMQTTQNSAAEETDEFIQKAVDYIDRHLSEKITLDDLAKHTSRSKSSFCHLFAEKMKNSPKQYILQKKLALANKLISDGTPPTIAAIQVGYENYSNFYRMYSKHYGINPAKKTP